jgi:hypothetical protein
MADDARGPWRTKSGKLLTHEDVERLAEEAERGYDPKTLKPRRLVMNPAILYAPWTPEQIQSLNDYQVCGIMHEYTCGSETCRQALVAKQDGWSCPACDYEQAWALEAHADGSWREPARLMRERLRLPAQ